MSQDIVPWKCHLCGDECDSMDAGICTTCGNVTCARCLGLTFLKVFRRRPPTNGLVCARCRGQSAAAARSVGRESRDHG